MGMSTTQVMLGQGNYAVGERASHSRRTHARQLRSAMCSDLSYHQQDHGSQLCQSSNLINAGPANNKYHRIHYLIEEERTDLACIMETWMGKERGIALFQMCPLDTPYRMQADWKCRMWWGS